MPWWGAGLVFFLVGGVLLTQMSTGNRMMIFIGGTFLAVGLGIFGAAAYKMKRHGPSEAAEFLQRDSPINPPPLDEERDSKASTSSRTPRRNLTQRKKDEIVYDRADEVCERCGEDTKGESLRLHVHHITPVSEGGSDNYSNLIALCPNCHDEAGKGAIPKNELRAKVRRQMERWSREKDGSS